MPHHLEQSRIRSEKVLSNIGARFDRILLPFAVESLGHSLNEHAVLVGSKEWIPTPAPDRLDDVPAGTAKHRFQFLNDVAVPANRPIEPLEIAIDDKDQIVELLARGQRDRTERFGFVCLAIAEKCPDFRFGFLLETAVFEIAIKPCLVDRHDWTESHRNCRKLPEMWHQPGMRIRRKAAFRSQFAAKVLQVSPVQAPLEKGARVDARRRVSLEIDDVAFLLSVSAAEEVIETDFI